MNRQRPAVPATFWGPIIDAELAAIRTAADPGERGRPDVRRWALRHGRSGRQVAAASAAARSLLAIAILLVAMVLALDRPDWGALLRHPGWSGPAFNLGRGIYPARLATDATF